MAITKKVVISDLDLLNDSVYTYTRVLIAGDILQEQVHLQAAFNKDSSKFIYTNWFKQIRPVLFIGDIVIGNLETTFSGPDYSGINSYSAPDEFLNSLKKSGFNVLLTANDKATDREGGGITRTLNMLDKARIRHTGTFRHKSERESTCPLMLKVKDINVAILNYTSNVKRQMADQELYNKLNLSTIKKDIQRAKEKNADYIIVYLHWGNEFEKKPLEYQRSIAKSCFDFGADGVFGTNSHYFQEVEIKKYEKNNAVEKGIIAYSMGNFLADVDKPGLNGGAIIELLLRKHKKTGVTTLHDYGYIPIWTQIEKNNFMVLPITNIDEDEVLQVKLNLKNYMSSRESLNSIRQIMFEKMEEIHYNLTDKVVDDVDETYVLQHENPSLKKVSDPEIKKEEISNTQIAFLEMFGSKKDLDLVQAKKRKDSIAVEERLALFRSTTPRRDFSASINASVSTFKKPAIEPKNVRKPEEVIALETKKTSALDLYQDNSTNEVVEAETYETYYTMSAGDKKKFNNNVNPKLINQDIQATNNLTIQRSRKQKENVLDSKNGTLSANGNIPQNSIQKVSDITIDSKGNLTNNNWNANNANPIIENKSTQVNTAQKNQFNTSDNYTIQSKNQTNIELNKKENTIVQNNSRDILTKNNSSSVISNEKSGVSIDLNNTASNNSNNGNSIVDKSITTSKEVRNSSSVSIEMSKSNSNAIPSNSTNPNNKSDIVVDTKAKTNNSNYIQNNHTGTTVTTELNNNKTKTDIQFDASSNEKNKSIANTTQIDKASNNSNNSVVIDNRNNTTPSSSSITMDRGNVNNSNISSVKNNSFNSSNNSNVNSNKSSNEVTMDKSTYVNSVQNNSKVDIAYNNTGTPNSNGKTSIDLSTSSSADKKTPSNNNISSTSTTVDRSSNNTSVHNDYMSKNSSDRSINNTPPATTEINSIPKKKYVPNYEPIPTVNRGMSLTEINNRNNKTQVITQTTDEHGNVITSVKKLELVSNEQTRPLPYKPKITGGIFTASEPTPVVEPVKKTPVAPKPIIIQTPVSEDVIYFYVQVFAYNEKKELDTEKYPYLKNCEVLIELGQYKYLVGKTKDLQAAAKLCTEIRAKGHPDAFMVKYINGKRAPFYGN